MNSILYIKSMVCVRCKMAVQTVLEEAGITYEAIELGWAKLSSPLTPAQKEKVKKGLRRFELEIIENKNAILIERIKVEVVRILQSHQPLELKLSAYLSQALDYNYTYLANLFSEHEGITLERYFIAQRVEKAKELIVYEDQSLSEITDSLGYSSVSHLCLQFKKVTGITPADFRKQSRTENFIWKRMS